MGAERVVYGDKVINLSNHSRGGKGLSARGCSWVSGEWRDWSCGGSMEDQRFSENLKVEFASQKGYTYDFYGSDFKDEGDAAMELAYALTIHKAQEASLG